MIAYFDASAVAAVVLRDASWQAVVAAIPPDAEAVFSDFTRGEAISAIAARARQAKVTTITATLAELHELFSGWREVHIGPGDVANATALVSDVRLPLRLPDAIHIAIAERHAATLLTTDRQQHRAALASGVSSINPLHPGDRP